MCWTIIPLLAPKAPRKTRAELMKDIDADYYGYRDEDDGVLVPLELEQERIAQAQKLAEYSEKKEKALREGKEIPMEVEQNIYAASDEEVSWISRWEDKSADKSALTLALLGFSLFQAWYKWVSLVKDKYRDVGNSSCLFYALFLQDDDKSTEGVRKKQKLEEPAQFIAHVPVPSQKEVSYYSLYSIILSDSVCDSQSDSLGALVELNVIMLISSVLDWRSSCSEKEDGIVTEICQRSFTEWRRKC